MSNKKRTLITAIVLIVIITLSLVGYTSCKKEPKPTKPTVTQPEVTTTVTKVEPTSTETEPLPTETTTVETEEPTTTEKKTQPSTTQSKTTVKPTETKKTTKPTTKPTTKKTEKPTTKQTEPKPTTTTHVHVYDIPIIETIHHPEEGHWEVRIYCRCDIDITDWTEEELLAHRKAVEAAGGFCSGSRTKNVYFVDKPAWDEEVVTGYKCACGAIKPD